MDKSMVDGLFEKLKSSIGVDDVHWKSSDVGLDGEAVVVSA
jgi:hypothetical protein